LIVDNSGSMKTEDINPAYDELKEYINNHEDLGSTTLLEDEFNNEDWLHLWHDILDGKIALE